LITPERIAKIQENSEDLMGELGGLADQLEPLCQQSAIDCSEDPRGVAQGNSINNECSINYDFAASSPSDRNAYLQKLAHDLALWNLPTTGSTQVIQDLLKESLTKEYALFEILEELRHGTINQAMLLYLVINVLPCILHLENHVGLKIISRLLRIRMDHVKANSGDVGVASETVRIQTFLAQMEGEMNSAIIGMQKKGQLFGGVLLMPARSKSEHFA
jgi:hypothetical protein